MWLNKKKKFQMTGILKHRANLRYRSKYISKWNAVSSIINVKKMVLESLSKQNVTRPWTTRWKSILYVSGKRDFLFPLFIGSRGKRKELSVAKIKKGKRTTMAEALWHSESALVR